MSSRKLLYQIIQKGGLMADCARQYINDEALAQKFILECSTQCHNKVLKRQWGKKLISEIKNFHSKNLLSE